jgi:hypothetical protein
MDDFSEAFSKTLSLCTESGGGHTHRYCSYHLLIYGAISAPTTLLQLEDFCLDSPFGLLFGLTFILMYMFITAPAWAYVYFYPCLSFPYVEEDVLHYACAIVYGVSMTSKDLPWPKGHRQAECVNIWKYDTFCTRLML